MVVLSSHIWFEPAATLPATKKLKMAQDGVDLYGDLEDFAENTEVSLKFFTSLQKAVNIQFISVIMVCLGAFVHSDHGIFDFDIF